MTNTSRISQGLRTPSLVLLLAIAALGVTSATVANAQVILQPGDILVADQSAAAVFLIRETPTGTTVTTVADSSISVDGLPIFTPGFCPNGIALNADGSIVVDDAKNSRVLRIEPGTGNVTVVAQGDTNPPPAFGGSGSGVLFRPLDFAIEANGDILVLQDLPPALFRIRADTGDVTTVASDDPFGSLGGIALEANGNILVTDLLTDAVFRTNPAGTSVTTVGVFGAGFGIAIEPDGQIVVTAGGSSVHRIDAGTGLVSFVGDVGAFLTNTDVTLKEDGDILVSSFPGGGRTGGVFRIDPTVSPFPGDPVTGRSANVTTVWDTQPLAGPHGILVVGAFIATPPPVADAQSLTTPEDTPIAITLSGSDPQNDPLTFAIAAGPARGVLSGMPPNLTYTPNGNFNGADQFTFTVSDGSATSDPATVAIAVSAVNDPPTAINDSATTVARTPVGTAVLANDRDVDGDVLAITGATPGSNGTTVVNANGTVTYTPAAAFVGIDQFSYTITDGQGATATARVIVTVRNPQRPMADVQVAISASSPVIAGELVHYTIDVRNAGPDIATDVIMTNTLPHGTLFVSVSDTTVCGGSANSAGCRFPALEPQAAKRVVVTARASRTTIMTFASVRAREADPDLSNNNAATKTTPQMPQADLSVSLTDSPDPVSVGQRLVYTAVVFNNGPDSARDAQLLLTIDDPTIDVVQITSTQGSCTRYLLTPSQASPDTFQCALGTLARRGSATVTFAFTVQASARIESRTVTRQRPYIAMRAIVPNGLYFDDPVFKNNVVWQITVVR